MEKGVKIVSRKMKNGNPESNYEREHEPEHERYYQTSPFNERGKMNEEMVLSRTRS